MFSIAQSTSFVAVFKAYLSSDHVSEATGKTIAITISKAGGAFGNPNAGATNATEISGGWYKVTLDTTDTASLGILALRGAAATIDDIGDRFYVVSASTGGFTNLDAAISSRMATYSQPSGFLAATFPTTLASTTNITAGTITTATNLTNAPTSGDFTAAMKTSLNAATPAVTVSDKTGFKLASDGVAAVTAWTVAITGNITGNLSGSVGSVTGLTASNLDVAVSTRLAGSSYTAPLDAAGVRTSVGLASANLDTQLDALPTSAELATALAGADDATLAAIAALPQTAAQTGDAMTLTIAYDAAKTAATQTSVDDLPTNAELATALAGADDATLAAIATLPDAATVNAIKAKTDSLTFTKTGEIDANLHSVNDVTVAGLGTTGSPWGP
jgi:hypothetical protein